MLTMEEAMKQTGALPFAAGNIVKGRIIEVRPKEVLVDIGYKSEGVISGNEFEDIKVVKVDDEIDVLLIIKTALQSEGFNVQTASSGSDALIAANPKPLQDYRAGKVSALGSLMGMVMKSGKGMNPKVVQERLKAKLD